MTDITKNKDILDLITLAVIQPDNVDKTISTYVIQEMNMLGKKISIEDAIQTVLSRVLDVEFSARFVDLFDELFTAEEITELLTFYRSDVVKKFTHQSMNIFMPLYEGYREIVKEVVQKQGAVH